MPSTQEGQLLLFGTPRWQVGDGAPCDVPDNLPGYLLVYLACQGTWVGRDTLTAAFWPERQESEAQNNLRANLHRVRALLSAWSRADALRSEQRRVRIDLPTDVAAFRAALSRADWPAAARVGGDTPLASLSFRGFAAVEEWLIAQRRAWAATWRDASLKAARALAKGGDQVGAADLLLRLLHDDVSNDTALRELLQLARAAGRRDEALAAFDRFRGWLDEELQLQPDPDVIARAAALRGIEPAAAPGAAPTDAADAAVRLQLLGPPRLLAPTPTAFRPERRFQLLTVLALRCGEWVARDELAALLWPAQPAPDARRNLRHTLFKAREVPGVADLGASDHALRWKVATDLQALQGAVREQRHADAVPLRRGSLAEGLDDPDSGAFTAWLAAERARVDALWHQAALDHLHALGDPAQRIAVAQRLLQVDPLDEAAMVVLLAAEMTRGHHAQARRLYRDYATRLADELGVEPPQPLRDLMADGVALGSLDIEADGDFVGRRTELAEIGKLLAQPDVRLITILGPGGVGKSSLARRALAQARTGVQFPGVAVWIELQDLQEIGTVVVRLAAQLGLPIKETQDALGQIARRLQGERALVVFDNAEHLGELSALVDRLLDAAPAVTVLLTSRVRTHSRHERILPLTGLAVPDEESRDLEAASAFDAVRLFERRALRMQRGFRLDTHLPAVIRIVEAVDGLPLAIDLAAAWTRLLPPEEIAADLRTSGDLLRRDPGALGSPARPEHVSLRTVLDRSWQLLAPREREAMAALSVFQGGFTRGAAQAVAGVPLPLLSALVDKSFLAVDEQGRFGIHPLVAEHAAERLARAGRRTATLRGRHAEHFSRYLADLAVHEDRDARPLRAAVHAEWINCWLAWQTALAHGRTDLVAQTVRVWAAYFDVCERHAAGVALLQPALDMPATDAPGTLATVRTRSSLAMLFIRGGKGPAPAMAVLRPAMKLIQRLGDAGERAGFLSWLGVCHREQGQHDLAWRCLERSLRIAREAGDRAQMAVALSNLGAFAKLNGRYDDAEKYCLEALAIETGLGHGIRVARVQINLAGVYMERAEWSRARQSLEQSLRLCRQLQLESQALTAEYLLGAVEVDLGALDAAERHLGHVVEQCRRLEEFRRQTRAEYNLARVAAKRGRFDQALVLLAAAARRALDAPWPYELLHVALFFGECLRDTGQRTEAARVWQAIVVHPIFDAGVRDSARRWLAELAPTPDEQADADGRPLTLDGVIDRVLSLAPTSEVPADTAAD